MSDLRRQLSGGDRRSFGEARAVATEVVGEPALLDAVFDCLDEPDVILRSRAAHVLRFVSEQEPSLLRGRRPRLLSLFAGIEQWEVREQLCMVLPKVSLTARQRERALDLLESALDDRSSIVRTCAMQALVDFCELDGALRPRVLPIIQHWTEAGTAAMRARGRKLLARLSDA